MIVCMDDARREWIRWVCILAVGAIVIWAVCSMSGCAAIQKILGGPAGTAPPEGQADPFGAVLTASAGILSVIAPWGWATLVPTLIQIFRQRRKLTKAELFKQVIVQVVQELRQHPEQMGKLNETVEKYCRKVGISKEAYTKIVDAVKAQLGVPPVS